MKFSITFNNKDCSGEPWTETFDEPYVKGIDDANDFAEGYAALDPQFRVLTVTMHAPVIRLRDVIGSPWES